MKKPHSLLLILLIGPVGWAVASSLPNRHDGTCVPNQRIQCPPEHRIIQHSTKANAAAPSSGQVPNHGAAPLREPGKAFQTSPPVVAERSWPGQSSVTSSPGKSPTAKPAHNAAQADAEKKRQLAAMLEAQRNKLLSEQIGMTTKRQAADRRL